MSKEQEYEVAFKSTTYRSYFVTSSNKKEAQKRAFTDLDNDGEVSDAWKENAKVSEIYYEEK